MTAILITGTPGVGKTALAKRIGRLLNLKPVNIGEYALRHGLILGYDAERKTHIINVNGVSRLLAKEIIQSATDILLEGHILPTIPRRLVRCVIVLRCHPMTLLKRLRISKRVGRKAIENCWAEALDNCLIEALRTFGETRVWEMDTTTLSIDKVTLEAMRIIRGKIPPGLAGCGWLEKLAATSDLQTLERLEEKYHVKVSRGAM